MAQENSGPPTTMDLVLLLMLLAPLASGDPRCPPLPNVNNRSIPTNGQCSSASDCSLAGLCVAGRCKCDPAFTGPNCAALNLLPAQRSAGYNPGSNGSSAWGGNPVPGPDGLWHFFGSEFTNGCDVGQWVSNSQVIRATSTHPSGPFIKAEVVADVFHHNANIVKTADGKYLLSMLGNGTNPMAINGTLPPPQQHCGHTSQQDQLDGAGQKPCANGAGCPLVYDTSLWEASSPLGPWSQLGRSLAPGEFGAWDEFRSNPAPTALPNGSLLMAYTGSRNDGLSGRHDNQNGHCKYVGLAIADRFDGAGTVFERISGDAPLWGQQCEDPSHVWQDARGNYHMLAHFFGREDDDAGQNPGGHAFSADLREWTFAGQAYGMNVTWDDGTTERMIRRERPFVLLVNGTPAFLFNAVTPPKPPGRVSSGSERGSTPVGRGFTMAQPINA